MPIGNEKESVDRLRSLMQSSVFNSPYILLACSELQTRRNLALAEAYKNSEIALERYKRSARSNNWLKMHGYPMRRRIPRR